MALSSGKYWTGDPDVKPDQWGPAADVQAAIRENAAGMGIDPPLIIMPFWENAGGKFYDYVSLLGYTNPSGELPPALDKNSAVFSNNAISINAELASGFSAITTFFDVYVGNTGQRKDLFFCSAIEAFHTMFRISFGSEEDITVGIRSQVSDSQVTYTISESGTNYFRDTWIHLAVRICLLSDKLDIFVNGKRIGGTNLSLTLNAFSDEVIRKWIGMRPDEYYPFSGMVKQFQSYGYAVPDNKIAIHSDNPYALILPIVRRFHSIPEGAGDVIAAACTDGFTFADSAAKTAILQATAIESINLSDSDENVAQFIAALVDSFTMADLPGNTAKYPVSVSDAFSVSDSTTALQKVIALVSDNVTFSDVSVVRADLTGIAEDNVTFAETLIANLHAQAIASEIINLSDSVNAELLGDLLAYVTETFNMSDSTTARADLVVLITDAFDLSDAATNTLQAYATATDGFTVSDTAFWAGVTQAIASDSFTVSGSVTGLIKLLAQAAETINFSDSGSVTATYNVQVNDAVEFATAISTIAQLRAAVSDGFNVTATPMEVSQLPNGKVSVSFSIKTPGADFSIKTATVVFNIK